MVLSLKGFSAVADSLLLYTFPPILSVGSSLKTAAYMQFFLHRDNLSKSVRQWWWGTLLLLPYLCCCIIQILKMHCETGLKFPFSIDIVCGKGDLGNETRTSSSAQLLGHLP